MLVRVHCAQVWQVRIASLWQAFQVQKSMMAQKLGRDTERWLWHGTADGAIQSINKEGFKCSYSRLPGTPPECMHWRARQVELDVALAVLSLSLSHPHFYPRLDGHNSDWTLFTSFDTLLHC